MIYVNNELIKPTRFPDHTVSAKFAFDTYAATHTEPVITWLYDSDEECMLLMYITNHLRSLGCKTIHLVMPYIPNARMDRVKDKTDIFTLKYFAGFINSLGFESVRVLDPHSNVSLALINNIIADKPDGFIVNAISTIREIENAKPFMFYPDEGAAKRYGEMFDLPHAFGLKTRNWSTGELGDTIKIYGDIPNDDLKNTPVLIVDDICSRGGTFVRAAKALKEINAGNIYLYVSHLEDNVHTGELLTGGYVKNIFTTNSIYRCNDPAVKVFSI